MVIYPSLHVRFQKFSTQPKSHVYVSTQSGVYYASVTTHNTLETVLKRAYFMTKLAVCSACDVRAINRRETR